MKRYLLFIISMLCVSIGTWAQDPAPATNGTFGPNDSEWSLADGVLTLTVNNAADIDNSYNLLTAEQLATVKRLKVVSASSDVKLSGGGWGAPLNTLYNNYKSVPVLDLSAAYVELSKVTDWNQGGIEIEALPTNNGEWFKNIVVPAAYRGDPTKLPIIMSAWNAAPVPTNRYTLTGEGTITVAIYEDYGDPSKLAPLSCFGPDMNTLKINNEVGAINLSSVLVANNMLDLTVIKTVSTGSNAITVASGVKAICSSDGVKDRVQGTEKGNVEVADPDIRCIAQNLVDRVTALTSKGIAPSSITILSEEGSVQSTEVNRTILNAMNVPGLRRLDLQDAVLKSSGDGAVTLGDITLPTTLEELVLPKSATPEANCTSLMTKITANSNLRFVYAPYTTHDASQMVADYIWVCKPGGLSHAMEHDAAWLKTAVYVKVASDVAGGVQLNEDDAKFGNLNIDASDDTNYPWQYIDLSGTFFGVAATNANTAPHNKGYRIILPDNLTGDHMALFASKPVNKGDAGSDTRGYRGIPAAVYSYKGTTLSIMEITDATYHPNALADSRIVRSGTTEVKVISGSYNGTTFSKFGPNLLTAINTANDTPNDDNDSNNHIKKVTVAVGTGLCTATDEPITSATTFAFTNTNLTDLTLSYINNQYVTINVTGCSALTNLQMNEATVAAVDAHGLSSLVTVSLGYTIVKTGDVNLSSTGLTSLEVDLAEIKGTLNVSHTPATSYDFSQLTAKSVDASYTEFLGKIDIQGIKLDNSEAWDVDYDEGSPAQKAAIDALVESRTGTVDVTRRTGNDDLSILLPIGFNGKRIVPYFDDISNLNGECDKKTTLWDEGYDYWLKTNYTSHIDNDKVTSGYSTYKDGLYDSYVDGEYKNYTEEKYNNYVTEQFEAYKALEGNSGKTLEQFLEDESNGLLQQYEWEEWSGNGLQDKDTWKSTASLTDKEAWLADPANNVMTQEQWKEKNYEDIIDEDAAKTAFSATKDAWLTQNYTNYIADNDAANSAYNAHLDEQYDDYKTWKYNETETSLTYEEWVAIPSNYLTKEAWRAGGEENRLPDTKEEFFATDAKYLEKDGEGNYKYLNNTAINAAWPNEPTPRPDCNVVGYNTEVEEEHSIEITIAGNSLQTNIEALKMIDSDGDETADSAPSPASIEILHVTDKLTSDDIDYIASMSSLQCLDLSGCSYEGVTYEDILNANLKKVTAIVLPNTSNKTTEREIEADMIPAIRAFQKANYECVGYYTKNNSNTSDQQKRLSVYGYNGTVGHLKTGKYSEQPDPDNPTSKLTQPKVVDNNTDITFLRRYKSNDIDETYSDGQDYPSATPSLLNTFHDNFNEQVYPFSVDMTWLNISNLGTDFHNVKCHYLVIPQNESSETSTRNGITYNNDFTAEEGTKIDNETTRVSSESYKYYKFNSEVYAVSTFKGNVSPYATAALFDGDALYFDNGFGHKNTTASLTYIRDGKQGHLTEIAPHISALLQSANIIAIKGTVNNNDVDGLNLLQNKCLDLTRATVNGIEWSNYTNSYVESIAMPYDGSATLASLPTVGVCGNLYGIGKLVRSEDPVSAVSSSKKSTLVYKAQKPGIPVEVGGAYDQRNYKGTGAIITMLHALNTNERKYVITSMTVGGPIAAVDISADSKGIDENGHLAVTIGLGGSISGSTQTGYVSGVSGTISGALTGYANVKSWDFSAVELPSYDDNQGKSYIFQNPAGSAAPDKYSYQYDLCYTKLGLAMHDLENGVKIPTSPSVWRLVDDALNNCSDYLVDLSIPYNYQYIGTAACYLAGLKHVTTTDAKGALIDNGPNTFTFSKNLKEIGNAPNEKVQDGCPVAQPYPVFFSEGIHGLTDVYALRTGYEDGGSECQPTKCYRGAFGAGPTYGWGGFNGGSVYCREKYLNGTQLFTVLHYPDRASVSRDKPTMVSSAPITSGRRAIGTDDYSEMEKLYTDPTKIYTKKDQTGAVDANGESPLWPTFSELGRSYNQAVRGLIWNDWNYVLDGQNEVNGGTLTFTPDAVAGVTSKDNSDHYDFTDYVGWHEFVLSLATYVAPDEKVEDNKVIRTYEEDDWYTFCIPFDMTEQEVALLLGVPRSTDEDPGTNIKIVNKLKGNSDGKVTENIMPTIVTLKQVTRSSSTNTVSLRCSEDMGSVQQFNYYNPTKGSYTSNGYVDLDGDSKEDADEKIMIRAGYPYIIRPYTLCDAETGEKNKVPGNNLGKQILTRYAFKMIASAINHSETREAIGGDKTGVKSNFAKPYEGHKVQALSDDQDPEKLYHGNPEDNKAYNYTFVGQYWTQYLPQNCFYMSGHKWYHNTYPREEGYYWYPYTCLILTSNEDESGLFRFATDNSKDSETNYAYTIIPEEIGKDKENHAVFDKVMQIRFKDGLDDSFTSNAREYHFVFDEDIMDFDEDGQTTRIDVLDGQHVAPVRGEVYNMAGQHVGNSLNGLPKGMYIVNGKKIVIR